MQFLQTARELYIYTIKKCVNIPKRYTFYISVPTANIATDIHALLQQGNSYLFPKNTHEAQLRRDCFLSARAKCIALIGQIEMINEITPLDKKGMLNWVEMINKELSLVDGILKKDEERYKNLPKL